MNEKVRVCRGYKQMVHSKAKAIKTRLLVGLYKAMTEEDMERLVCRSLSEYRKQTDRFIYDCD